MSSFFLRITGVGQQQPWDSRGREWPCPPCRWGRSWPWEPPPPSLPPSNPCRPSWRCPPPLPAPRPHTHPNRRWAAAEHPRSATDGARRGCGSSASATSARSGPARTPSPPLPSRPAAPGLRDPTADRSSPPRPAGSSDFTQTPPGRGSASPTQPLLFEQTRLHLEDEHRLS